MKIAIPVVNEQQAKIVGEVGFLVGGLPTHNFTVDFLDNGFYQKDISRVDLLNKLRSDQPEFVVVPDTNLSFDFPPYFTGEKIYPIHQLKDLEKVKEGKWVAFPRPTPTIDAPPILDFLANTEDYKRWFLGFTEGWRKYLPFFDGFDTSICQFYASISEIWYSWGRSKQVDGKYYEKFKRSLKHFKKEIQKVLNQTLLEEHL